MGAQRIYEEADQEVAAYLLQQHCDLVETVAVPRMPYSFRFDDRDGRCIEIASRFNSSPESEYANALRRIRRAISLAKQRLGHRPQLPHR